MSSNNKYDIHNAYTSAQIYSIKNKIKPLLKLDYDKYIIEKNSENHIKINGYIKILNINNNKDCLLYFNNNLDSNNIDDFIVSTLIKDSLIYKYFSEFDFIYLEETFGLNFVEGLKREYEFMREYL